MQTSSIGEETTLEALGKTWRLARWDRGIWKKWIRWAQGEFPDPVQKARSELLQLAAEEGDLLKTIETAALSNNKDESDKANRMLQANRRVQDLLSSKAISEASDFLSIGSPKAYKLLKSPEGCAYLLYLLLQKHQPDVTEDAAMELLMKVGLDEVEKRFDEASGLSPDVPKNGQSPAS